MAIRVGVIGVGYLGQHHARIYSGLEEAQLVAVADTDAARSGQIAEKYGCKAYTDYRRLVEDVQAVSIVTPTSFHFDVAMDCLSAGKDVLIEKPITSTVAEADALIEVAARKNALLQVGHLERYNPAVATIARLAVKPRFIESERISPFLQRAANVDVTLDLMIHDIDIITSLLQGARVKDVKVVGARVLTPRVDVAKAWIEFEGGTSALITASRLSGGKQRLLKVYQDDSYLLLDYQKMNIRRFFMEGGEIGSETIEIEQKEPLKEELRDFIECVKERRRPKVSGVEGRDALEVALMITDMIKHAGEEK